MKKWLAVFLLLCGSVAYGQTPPGAYGPSIGGSSSGSRTFSGGTVLDVTQSPYNVKTGFIAFDCGWTNTQSTVTCTTTTFTSAEIGWVMFGTSGCCGAQNLFAGTTTMPVGTITGCSPSCPSHVATVSSTANATTSQFATFGFLGASIFGFGPDMSTNLATAFTAAIAGPN